MINYVKGISGENCFRIGQEVLSIYHETGRENSKFFPLLNYAARELLGLAMKPHDAIEDAALRWVNDNMGCILRHDYRGIKNGFTVDLIDENKGVTGNYIHSKNCIFFNKTLDLQTRMVMHDCNYNGYVSKSILRANYPHIVNSIMTLMSEDFRDALASLNSEIGALHDEGHVMRLIKESATLKTCETKMGLLSDIIREHLREDDSHEIVFSLLFCGEPYICHCHRESCKCTLFNSHNITAITDMSGLYGIETNVPTALMRQHVEGIRLAKKVLCDVERQRDNFIR